jgi:oxygen-dependent protoporphyrinogen oxidase
VTPADGDRSPRVAVIGGGIAGLAAAYELTLRSRERGVPVTVDVYEARDRLGGVIQTERVGDYVLDAGPDAILTLKPSALELCRELGLGDAIIPTRPEHQGVALYSRGKLRPLPYGTGSGPARKLAAYLASGVVSWRAKLRMAADLFLPRGRPREDESMAEFFGRRLGREAVERLVDPLVAGIYSGDPYRLSVYATFPRFPELVARRRSLLLAMLRAPEGAAPAGRRAGGSGGSGDAGDRRSTVFVSLREGLSQLVDALAGALSDARVLLGAEVKVIGRSEGGYRVVTPRGVASYDDVVLAVPAWSAARLVSGDFPAVSRALGSVRYVSSATVFLAYRRADLGDRLRGYGFLVPTCEGRRINGATWITNKFEGRAPADGFLVRCFVGGDRTGEVLEADDETLVRVCREELHEIAGIAAEPLFTRLFRWPRSNPQYEVGHAARVRELDRALAEHPGLYVTGSGFRGIGLPECVRAGREAARHALDARLTAIAASG